MNKTITACILAVLTPATTFAALDGEQYAVSPLAWEVNVKRIGHVLARYVRFSSVHAYPCLRLETFETPKLKLINRKDVCSLRINNEAIDLRHDVSGVFFENVKWDDNRAFLFDADITLKGPGSYYLNCSVAISDSGKLSEPACTQGSRPPEPDDMK